MRAEHHASPVELLEEPLGIAEDLQDGHPELEELCDGYVDLSHIIAKALGKANALEE